MKLENRAIQGNSDGLCGLYALVNFLILKDEVQGAEQYKSSAAQERMRYLMQSAERLGLLTASRLYWGYEWPELIEIFNHYAEHNFFPYFAAPLRDASEKLTYATNGKVLKAVIDVDGAAVVLTDNSRHWVLAYDVGDDGSFDVIDPAYDEPRLSLKRTSDINDGLVLLPLQNNLLARN